MKIIKIFKRALFTNNYFKKSFSYKLHYDSNRYVYLVYLTAWLSRCKGIATKYINHYYNFYSLIDSEKVFDYMSIFFDLLKNGSYTSVEVLRTNHIEDY
ncbi:hypothetical protein [Clostridium butyricum]